MHFIRNHQLKSLLIRLILFIFLSLIFSPVIFAEETLNLNVGFEKDSHSELLKKAWGSNCPVVVRNNDCLEFNSGSALVTDFLPCNSSNINVNFDLKLTDIVPGNASYKKCWINVSWYDSSKSNLGHSDILITDIAADWHNISKVIDSQPANTEWYKVIFYNAGTEGIVWIDNISIISDNVDIYEDFDSSTWYTEFPSGWGTKEIVDHNNLLADHSDCLELEADSAAYTTFQPYSSGDVNVSLYLKHTDIVPGNASYKKCWINVIWYDTTQTYLGHSDIIIDGEATDWYLLNKQFNSPPTGTCWYKLKILNSGTAGTVWVDNVSLTSNNVDFFTDFESSNWTSFLSGGWGTRSIVDSQSLDLCIEIPSGTALQNRTMLPYQGDRVKVSFDLKLTDIVPGDASYKVAWAAVNLYDINDDYIEHLDILATKEKKGWDRYEKTFEISRNTRSIKLSLFNAGSSGTMWIDNVKIVIEKDGTNACTDSSFKSNLLYGGKWTAPTSGMDWNNTELYSNGAIRKVSAVSAAGENSSLYISGNATVISPLINISSSDILHLGAWTRTRNITGTSGAARVQLVYYNSSDQIIAHEDLSALDGDNNWVYSSCEYYPPANAAKAAVWARILENGQGEAWFDEITLLKLENPIAYSDTGGSVSIDANSPASANMNSSLWENISSAYFGRVLDSLVAPQLQTIMNDNIIKRFRGFDIIQNGQVLDYIDNNGNPVYDFSKLDNILDNLVYTYNLTPLITIETTPNQISSNPDSNNNTFTNRYPPNDYNLWGRIVKDTLIHIVNRYGANAVSSWAFDIWNEPSASKYFKGTQKEFFQIYDKALEALVEVENQFNISLQKGTMSAAGTIWLEPLFDHLQQNNTLQHVDFISFHAYAGAKLSFGAFRNIITKVKSIRDQYSEIAGKPIQITEYNCNSSINEYFDTQVVASFIPKVCRLAVDEELDRIWFFSAYTYYPSSSPNLNEHFSQLSGMMTISNIHKPSANVFFLLNKFDGNKRLPFTSTNEPVDGLATISSDGKTLKVLITTFDERELKSIANMNVSVTVNWSNIPQNIKAHLIKIDENYGNAHTTWENLGEPLIDQTTPAEWSLLNNSSELVTETFTNFNNNSGQLTFTVTMQRNSVIYLEFTEDI